jgi:hypothetical protein
MKEAKIFSLEIENKEVNEIIVGQGNFTIKTIEDLFNAMVSSVPGIEFGIAMNEAKPKLTRKKGNSIELEKKASELALKIGAGHVFVVVFRKAFPIHVLNAIKSLPTIANVFCATSNKLELIIAETSLGKALLGAIDGTPSEKIETKEEEKERTELLKKLGFKK